MPELRLHIENNRALGPIFDLTPQQVEGALERNAPIPEGLDITVGYDGDRLDEALPRAQALIGWNFPRDDLARRAPHLKWVHLIGAGVNHVMPLDWMPKGAVLTNNRGVHGERAAEYVIGALLMLNNRLPEMVTHQREGRWQQCFNTAIHGKTLLLIGVGHVGGDAARWAKRFGLYVIGVRRTGRARAFVDEMHKPDAIPDLIPRADFVAMCAPDTSDSHHLLGRKEIAALKRGAGLVNYSRAGLVDYEALSERLNRGEVSAILDVFDPEPLPESSPLWKVRNLIITPHCSSDDPAAYVPRTLDIVLANARRLIAGKRLLNVVNPKLQY